MWPWGLRLRDSMKFLHSIFFCFLFFNYSFALDNLAPNQTLRDGNATLVSVGSGFELGFFSPENSKNRYIGIWFKDVPKQTVVWAANKNSPLNSTSGVLTITSGGNIVIMDSQSGISVWSSNSSGTSPVLRLLDTGNLVVVDGSGSYVWQSFDHPCDTLLPGMKMGSNLQTGQDWYLTSWTSQQDPSAGNFTYKLDHRGLPAVILRWGSQVQFRSGPWDGERFGGGPELQQNTVFIPRFILNTTHVYYTYDNVDNNTISRFVLSQSGSLQYFTWSRNDGVWVPITTLNANDCDDYEKCGPYGICDFEDQWFCHCPDGFTPRSPQSWNQRQTSDGCVAKTPLNCSASEGFRKVSMLKLPDNSYLNMTIISEECENACLSSCSCVAYAKTEVSSCVLWFGDLLDMRTYSIGGQDLYIRLAASELESDNHSKRTAAIISAVVVSGVIIAAGLLLVWYICRKKTTAEKIGDAIENPIQVSNHGIGEEDLELPLFDLGTIRAATEDFSLANKIGEGGFGPVYRGQLSTGQEIAVKRLSENSGQGLKEFKNEVILIAKLQHRNLVKLLGCCIHGDERMLIYEYMPNKSLDFFIFNQTKGDSLDWGTRFDIIVGIARGLVYLHRDSRLRIIHRDLKASNVLLDGEMNPKISDFGLARLFGGDQTEANTNRVMGTYGYMSPEYAIDGIFSAKSDVFSFGVLVLEIVSGRRNRGFFHSDHDLNLLGHAWKLWSEGRAIELADALLEGPSPRKAEALLCVQLGLLCVQQRPEDRPTMSFVVLSLDSENIILPQPKQPGFYTERFPVDTDSSSTGKQPTTTTNELTVTILHAR